MSTEIWSLAELTSRFLDEQSAARRSGFAEFPCYEVEPHDSIAGPVADPRSAWSDALAALACLSDSPTKVSMTAPPGWIALSAIRFPVVALPFACGHFPQMVRDLPALIRREPNRLADGLIDFTERNLLVNWIESAVAAGRYPESLVGFGLCRVMGDNALAERLATRIASQVPDEGRLAWQNEEAAFAWSQGKYEQANRIWASLPNRPPIVFNRGLAALFTGRMEEARQHFTTLRGEIPEESCWRQLSELYLALSWL